MALPSGLIVVSIYSICSQYLLNVPTADLCNYVLRHLVCCDVGSQSTPPLVLLPQVKAFLPKQHAVLSNASLEVTCWSRRVGVESTHHDHLRSLDSVTRCPSFAPWEVDLLLGRIELTVSVVKPSKKLVSPYREPFERWHGEDIKVTERCLIRANATIDVSVVHQYLKFTRPNGLYLHAIGRMVFRPYNARAEGTSRLWYLTSYGLGVPLADRYVEQLDALDESSGSTTALRKAAILTSMLACLLSAISVGKAWNLLRS